MSIFLVAALACVLAVALLGVLVVIGGHGLRVADNDENDGTRWTAQGWPIASSKERR